MSILEDLQSAVSTVAERAGPCIVGIGRGSRGSGIVIADGKVLTNAHNLRGDEVTVTFADGRRTRGTVSGVDGDGDLAVVDVDTTGATALEWGDGESLALGGRSSGPPPATVAGHASRSASSRRRPASFRGPGGRRISGSIEHTAPLAPGSSGGALLDATARSSASTPTGSARASTWPCRRMPRCASGSMPSVAASRPRPPASASRSPRPMSPGGCVARSGCRNGPACWSVASRTTASADAAGIDGGDLIVSAGGKAIADADDLFEALWAPLKVAVRARPCVRGTEERTVTVG